ncbi:MAG: ABC transporter substrate-binding protein [Acidobacteria bacterium]|nr:ABC transporter substrate-binding protein [Acidobacteriota bacterium]
MAAVSTRLTCAASLAVCLLAGVEAAQAPRPAGGGGARRIVSLIPATTEMLFAIGAGDRIAGVSSFDTFPPGVGRLPRVGGLLDPNVEQILSLKPDLAIVYATQSELRQQLERAQIPMFLYEHRGLPDVTATMRALGARVGMAEAADAAAAHVEQRLAAIAGRVAGRPRPKTLLVFGRDPGALRHISASGGYGFLHDLLEMAGGSDVLADVRRQSVDVSTEMILARAPEAIVELHYGETRGDDLAAERHVWDALPSVAAVRNGRVYLLSGQQFVVPGPRVVDALEQLARALHPDAF